MLLIWRLSSLNRFCASPQVRLLLGLISLVARRGEEGRLWWQEVASTFSPCNQAKAEQQPLTERSGPPLQAQRIQTSLEFSRAWRVMNLFPLSQILGCHCFPTMALTLAQQSFEIGLWATATLIFQNWAWVSLFLPSYHSKSVSPFTAKGVLCFHNLPH